MAEPQKTPLLPSQEKETTSPPNGTTTTTSPSQNGGKKEKGRVRFNSTAGEALPNTPRLNNDHDAIQRERTAASSEAEDYFGPMVKRPRPSIVRGSSYNSFLDNMDNDNPEISPEKAQSAAAAHQRAQAWAQGVDTEKLGPWSAQDTRRSSYDSEETTHSAGGLLGPNSIALNNLMAAREQANRQGQPSTAKTMSQDRRDLELQAYNLVRAHTVLNSDFSHRSQPETRDPLMHASGDDTPDHHADHGREGVLSSLLKLYHLQNDQPEHGRRDYSSGTNTPGFTTPGSSGAATPTRRKWYKQEKNRSQDTLANLTKASAILSMDPNVGPRIQQGEAESKTRPKHKRTHSASSKFTAMIGKRAEQEARITIHVADILKRQEYIIKLCRALMLFGAPTHRLEEYLNMAAKVLEIRGQFLYIPGCMIISFDDIMTHTTEVKIVRTVQGVNLGKLKDIHEIYKEVLHDVTPLDEAIPRLEEVTEEKDRFHPWVRVMMYGFASATVAPFAFGGRLIDMPIAFILGSLVGILQLIIAPLSDLYSNVFEIMAAILTSFLARLFGSIRGGELFCFSALAQSSIALILPGYLVLCAALELQSKSIVPGSIRMVYAIIYSLFLGFGITVGTAMYGMIDSNAVSSTTCNDTMEDKYFFVFVPLFAFCLMIVNQAKWKQMPVMTAIALIGYVVNYFSSKKFPASAQISNTFGAFAIGITANVYSRVRHGVAAAALLPAIFVQVPSGLAASGSLLSGLSTANQLTNSNSTAINGTATLIQLSVVSSDSQNLVFNVAASMIQIAIGITVGLFGSAVIIYPFGKRRSGLFTL
ncbi:uncharacterized protein BCR38DRAFT_404112 [Pseudomassariella vexata]|uniref:Threonine/serine exporter-like N-terminal domain-containing protein n=1 Tax=Pseudomassariella vexata TaxID=1141098 RepID=A0A1Y2EHD4_9PEZI|nr:uncharacterized protein BCR38DRAFT_404112 [Pseudomassariella vexata]ORY70980.1 hypothetical protein BCR38DRAFT_404112 [Pseudomassariella vexata]